MESAFLDMEETPGDCTSTKNVDIQNGKFMMMLVTLCIGLKNSEGNGDLLDTTIEPFKSMKVWEYKPKLPQLHQEVL